MNLKKIQAIIRSKKYSITKMGNEPTYYKSIKAEMAERRIYLFSEYQD